MNRASRVALGLAVLALAAGCTSPSERAAAEPGVDGGSIPRQQARDDLARYDKALAKANGGQIVVDPPRVDARYDKALAKANGGRVVVNRPWKSSIPPPGLGIDSAARTADGRRLTVGFRAAKDPATVPCGADYSAEAVEGTNAVVVIMTVHPRGPGETCTQEVRFSRAAPLTLAHPLGKRAVLDVVWGEPVTVQRVS